MGKPGIAYAYHNPETGQLYVGSTGHEQRRKSSHLSSLRKGIHPNRRFQNAYDRNPNFEYVAFETGDRDEAFDFEQSVLDEQGRNPLLLNLSRDARAVVINHTEESNEKNRQATARRWQDPHWRQSVSAAQRAGHAAMSEEEKLAYGHARSAGLKEAYASGRRQSNAGQVRSEEFKQQARLLSSEMWKDPAYRQRQTKLRAGREVIGPGRKAVCVDGKYYESLTAAGEAHGLTKQGVSHRISSDRWPGWTHGDSEHNKEHQ